MWTRLGLAAGAAVALLVTPAFALSYYPAYGLAGETPAPWLAALRGPLSDIGLLGRGTTEAYDRYGTIYLTAWVVALTALGSFLRSRPAWWRRRLRPAWLSVLGSLALVAIGMVGDYAVAEDLAGGIGFLLTGVGFLGAVVSFPFLGRALRRELAVNLWVAWSVGVLGAVSVVGGVLLVGHIPSGPGAGFAFAALVLSAVAPAASACRKPELAGRD